MWDGLLAMAPTLVYDGLALGRDDQSLPRLNYILVGPNISPQKRFINKSILGTL
jgi:hypothetical protein